MPEDPADVAAAAAVAYRKRPRTDAGARRATVRASSIFEERRSSAEEAQRLQRLQTRRARGMQLAPTREGESSGQRRMPPAVRPPPIAG